MFKPTESRHAAPVISPPATTARRGVPIGEMHGSRLVLVRGFGNAGSDIRDRPPRPAARVHRRPQLTRPTRGRAVPSPRAGSLLPMFGRWGPGTTRRWWWDVSHRADLPVGILGLDRSCPWLAVRAGGRDASKPRSR